MQKTLKYIAYGIYNLIYLKIILFLLLFAETYLNSFLIPDKFLWNENGTKREHPIIWGVLEDGFLLVIESILLLLLLYNINKWFLKKVVKLDNPKGLLLWTIGILSGIIIVFLASLFLNFNFPLLFW